MFRTRGLIFRKTVVHTGTVVFYITQYKVLYLYNYITMYGEKKKKNISHLTTSNHHYNILPINNSFVMLKQLPEHSETCHIRSLTGICSGFSFEAGDRIEHSETSFTFLD
jgi:hypothetical protein